MKTPCVKICKLIDSVCIGCGRTSEQISEWTKYTDEQREEIIKEIQSNHYQVLTNNYDRRLYFQKLISLLPVKIKEINL